jgi:hypothetical protein
VTQIVVAAVCVGAGFVLGRVTPAPAPLAPTISNPVNVSPASSAPAPAPPASTISNPATISGAPSVPAQRRPENATPPPVSKPTPSVVLLNPGTATPPQQDARDAAPTKSEPPGIREKRRPTADVRIREQDERERASYPARDYRELRDYLFRR